MKVDKILHALKDMEAREIKTLEWLEEQKVRGFWKFLFKDHNLQIDRYIERGNHSLNGIRENIKTYQRFSPKNFVE